MNSNKQPLSAADAQTLLDLLCSDDGFREKFALDPAAAMAQISDEAAAACDTCTFSGPLASKQEFQAARVQLIEHLAASAAFFVPHCFMSGNDPSSAPRGP